MSALQYTKAKLFDPLGIIDVYWRHDPQGISSGEYGLYLQPRDKILDVSTEKPTKVDPTPKMAALISGKVYGFPPTVKS